MGDVDDLVVTYTVKELLAQIQTDVTIMSTKLDNKADKADVVQLDQRVSVIERFMQRAIGAAVLLTATGFGGGYFLKEILGA